MVVVLSATIVVGFDGGTVVVPPSTLTTAYVFVRATSGSAVVHVEMKRVKHSVVSNMFAGVQTMAVANSSYSSVSVIVSIVLQSFMKSHGHGDNCDGRKAKAGNFGEVGALWARAQELRQTRSSRAGGKAILFWVRVK
jgi:hypothetical protein